MFFQDKEDEDVCEEEDLAGNRANNSANRKRQLWWELRQGTDEKNVCQGILHWTSVMEQVLGLHDLVTVYKINVGNPNIQRSFTVCF